MSPISRDEIAQHMAETERLTAALSFGFGPPELQSLMLEAWQVLRGITHEACNAVEAVEERLRNGLPMMPPKTEREASIERRTALLHALVRQNGVRNGRV